MCTVYASACYASITEMNSTDRFLTSIADKNDRSMFSHRDELNSTVQIGTVRSTYVRVLNVCVLYIALALFIHGIT